jgi:hypothetical protein
MSAINGDPTLIEEIRETIDRAADAMSYEDDIELLMAVEGLCFLYRVAIKRFGGSIYGQTDSAVLDAVSRPISYVRGRAA